ncbi:MAG: outer membrane protein assembly factor BamB family protein [Acidimicrobiales bacterium]
MWRRAAVFGALGALVAMVAPAVSATAPAGLVSACATTDWPMFGHDLGRSFASTDTCISPVTATSIAPKWFFNTSAPVTAEPVVSGNSVFVGAFNGVFYSIDATKGTKNWSFDTAKYDHEVNDYGLDDSAAVATVGTAKIVVFGGGDTVFALNAANGGLLSRVCLDRLDTTCQGASKIVSEIETSPAIVPWTTGALWPEGDDLVLVGNDANEADPSPVEGLVALVLDPSGTLTPWWQFDPETDINYVGLAPIETSPVDHGCSDVWSSPTVDLASRTVVFGVGNCNHPTAANQDEGTVATDLDTGALKWQAEPISYTNQQDLDFGATPNLLGQGLVGEGGKDGVYYAYELNSTTTRAPGPAPAWSATVATSSDIGGMIGSTAVGQITNRATAGRDEAVFCDTAIPVAEGNPRGSIENDVLHPAQAFGVHGVDAVTHKVVWNDPAAPTYGAAGYDNGVVFTPDTVSDSLWVLDAETGAPLRIIPLESPPSSPVAVSGGSLYMGSGTTEAGLPVLPTVGGVWGLSTTL